MFEIIIRASIRRFENRHRWGDVDERISWCMRNLREIRGLL
jgi:hypothetical protein